MICVSLGSGTFDDCFKALPKSEFTEIRIDLLHFSTEQLKTLFSYKRKTIATCRPANYSQSERLELLKNAISEGAGFIDIEYEAEEGYRKELIEFAKQYNTKVIISYHDYQKTPDKNELDIIIGNSFKWGAHYAKLATMAVSDADNARVLGLYEYHNNIIAFCMGEKGVITRVSAPILGSLFTFAALNAEQTTAPGQLTLEQFRNIYNSMGISF